MELLCLLHSFSYSILQFFPIYSIRRLQRTDTVRNISTPLQIPTYRNIIYLYKISCLINNDVSISTSSNLFQCKKSCEIQAPHLFTIKKIMEYLNAKCVTFQRRKFTCARLSGSANKLNHQ